MGDINSTGRKVICSFISVIIAFCLALSISSVVASGVLKTHEFVAERLLKCNSILLDELNKKDEEILSKYSKFPVKAFTDSVGEGHIKTVLLRTASNLVFGYKTDFSNSSYLYGYYKTGLINYCKNNGIPVDATMEDQISRDSAMAVDVFNQVCGDESTNFIIPFQEAQSSISVKLSIVCAIVILVCALIIRRLNFGDYFMYSYGAMAVIIAGAVMIFLPAFGLIMDYSSLFDFTDVYAYNVGIKYCMEDVLKILSITGVVLTLVGIVAMNVVYSRFRNIVMAINTEMEIAQKLRKEYMEDQMKFEMEQGLIDTTQESNDEVKSNHIDLTDNTDLIDARNNYNKRNKRK